MLDFVHEMQSLAKRRPIFHSEADFQHELALALATKRRNLELRLEHPRDGGRGAIDIVGREGGRRVLALELKYLCGRYDCEVRGERFQLKAQSAYPLRRYDVVKDLVAMEAVTASDPQSQAAVIVLTNDPGYWEWKRERDTSDVQFRFHHQQVLAGERSWSEDASVSLRRGRVSNLPLTSEYTARWHDYATIEHAEARCRGVLNRFRFLVLEVVRRAPPR